jgi:hypothetical protein
MNTTAHGRTGKKMKIRASDVDEGMPRGRDAEDTQSPRHCGTHAHMHIRTFHEESCADLYTRSLIVIILSSRLSAFCNVDPRIDCGGGGIIDGVGCSTAAAAAAATARSAPSLMLLPPALAFVFRERLESRLVDLTGVLLVVLLGLVSGVSFCFTGLAALGPCRPMYEYAVPPGMLARCAIGVA